MILLWYRSDQNWIKMDLNFKLNKCLKMVICWIRRCGSSHSATFKWYMQLSHLLFCFNWPDVGIWMLYSVGSITQKPASRHLSARGPLTVSCDVLAVLFTLSRDHSSCSSSFKLLHPPSPSQMVMKPPWSLLTDSGTTQRPLLLVTRRFRWNLA